MNEQKVYVVYVCIYCSLKKLLYYFHILSYIYLYTNSYMVMFNEDLHNAI